MIKRLYRASCDRCGMLAFGGYQVSPTLARRRAVKDSRWKRVPKLDGKPGADYCPTCAEAVGAEKHVDKRDEHAQMHLIRRFGALAVVASVPREEVCERVVTGTREVTESVPDPEAMKEVPIVEVTKTVEDVEWRCRPLLAAEREPAEASAA